MKINAQITILSTYDDEIWIKIYDKSSGSVFVDMVLTREQFVNATMNRLGNTEVKSTYVCNFDKIGKQMEMQTLEFQIPMSKSCKLTNKDIALSIVHDKCPDGWKADTSFSSQDSFFQNENGKECARTTIRRWV
jgi:hypothetical protein